MSLYKPKNTPYWHFDFQLSGVRFHGSTGTTIKGKARLIEAQHRNDAASGSSNRKRRPMTLDAAAGRYFVEIGEHQPSAGTTEYQLGNLIADVRPPETNQPTLFTDRDTVIYGSLVHGTEISLAVSKDGRLVGLGGAHIAISIVIRPWALFQDMKAGLVEVFGPEAVAELEQKKTAKPARKKPKKKGAT